MWVLPLVFSLPISQIPCKKWTKFFAGERFDIPINTKRLVRISLYPCKIDLVLVAIQMSIISWTITIFPALGGHTILPSPPHLAQIDPFCRPPAGKKNLLVKSAVSLVSSTMHMWLLILFCLPYYYVYYNNTNKYNNDYHHQNNPDI